MAKTINNNIELKNIELIDVIFENCDLSNKNLNNCFLQRVKFINCKIFQNDTDLE